MSKTSGSRVIITLGGTGQVVKRGGSSMDSSFTDSHPGVGSKRSVRERLGNNGDSSSQVGNKRLRGDGRTANAIDDMHLSKNDLRYKIMKKNTLKQSQSSQHNGGDLRSILSRPAQSSTNSITTHQRLPEPHDRRPRYIDPTVGRQQFAETRDDRHLLPMNRNLGQQIPEFRSQYIPDTRKSNTLEAREGGRSVIEQKEDSRMMPMRAPSGVTRTGSGISSYSPWNLDSLRRRPSDEGLEASRSISVPKRDEELERRYAVRTYDDARTSTYISRDDFEFSKPVSSSHLVKMKTTAVSPLPVSGSLPRKTSYVGEDQLSVDSLLRSLDLEKFAVLFKAEEVDMYSLKRMTERDLKEMGLPMGPRKKILLALQPRLKQQEA